MLRRGQHPFQESIRFVWLAQDHGLSLPHLAPSLAAPSETRKRPCELHLVRLGLQEPAAGRVRPSSVRAPSSADEQRLASTGSSCSPPSTVTVVVGRAGDSYGPRVTFPHAGPRQLNTDALPSSGYG